LLRAGSLRLSLRARRVSNLTMPEAIDIWRTAQELVRLRGTDAPQYVAQKAAEASDENAWAFWLEVERAVTELLAQAAPPDVTQH
jgi:hypothetical protein